ncbi:hypothetical protein [Algoriphagus resistens]|uniref:hypothetical protein n=1 Tax=Algoriphagus resistens TaxID=1750590 RepID=UPI000716AB38|nr:hypothetical protein [Algoriphagus resistens]
MKEYNPKPDLWSKIQQRKNFDVQVREHLPNLPKKMPKADLWTAIERELDQKKPVIPLWKYGMVAASIGLILMCVGIAYLEFGETDVKPQMITGENTPPAEHIMPEEKPFTKTGSALNATEETQTENPDTNASIKKPESRETIPLIKLPRRDLADLSIENTYASKLIIPPTTEHETPKTLHQVSISWSKIKPGLQLKTPFGRQESELGQKASIDQVGQATLEINN